jgi:quercetin dioxygenase-like cupin family protein
MKILDFSGRPGEPIDAYGSVGASSVRLADGAGAAHVYCVRFAPGGVIGDHEAGFGQLFLVIEGSGWAMTGTGAGRVRLDLAAGQAAYFARGEVHAKGSDVGMTAIMIQVDDLRPGGSGS